MNDPDNDEAMPPGAVSTSVLWQPNADRML